MLEEIIEWLGEFLIELFTGTRRTLLVLFGLVSITLGIVQLSRNSGVLFSILLFTLGIIFILLAFIRKRTE